MRNMIARLDFRPDVKTVKELEAWLQNDLENINNLLPKITSFGNWKCFDALQEPYPILFAHDMKLTDAQISRWHERGGCPNCGYNNEGNAQLQYSKLILEEAPYYKIKCEMCGYKWREVYQLVLLEADN